MKLKTKLYLYQIVFTALLVLFEFATYKNYEDAFTKDLHSFVEDKAKLYKEQFLSSYQEASNHLQTHKKLFIAVHKEAVKQLQNQEIPLQLLSQNLAKQFHLNNITIDIFLIDKNYIIVKTTFAKDLGLNLAKIAVAKRYLDLAKKEKNKIFVSDFISTDAINLDYKLYSYSTLNNNYFLELGFVDRGLYNNFKMLAKNFLLNNNGAVYMVSKYKNFYSYYNFVVDTTISKKEIDKIQTIIPKKQIDKNPVTKAVFLDKSVVLFHNNTATVYKPIFHNSMIKAIGVENIVLKIEVDIGKKLQALKQYQKIFLITIAATLIVLFFIQFIIKKYFTDPIEKITHSMKHSKVILLKELPSKNDELSQIAQTYNILLKKLNHEIQISKTLLEENKTFIANTVHQIRTPLTNIMMNTEMIKMVKKEKQEGFLDQIDASINMLNNSYEDLSYILTSDTMEYQPANINISFILEQRVLFFKTIAKMHKKVIDSKIEENLFFTINQIEFERLVDNNIANGIKYATPDTSVVITLQKQEHHIVLEFATYGSEIADKEKIFQKDYREDDAKRGLGLGLFMVSNIAKKYNITYRAYYKDGKNIFEYRFDAAL